MLSIIKNENHYQPSEKMIRKKLFVIIELNF